MALFDIIGGIIGLGTDIIGGIVGAGEQAKAQDAFNKAFEQIQSTGAPPALAKELLLKEFQQAGILTPEIEQKIDVGISKVSQISEDPSIRDARVNVLNQLQQLGKTGINAEDRVVLNEIREQAQRDAEAKRQQILQNMQARGLAGSGAELAASLQASQSAANEQAAAGDRQAAIASQRALQALLNADQTAASLRGQDFDIAKTKAGAEDAFRTFDVQNQVGQQMRNVNAKNTASQINLANVQDIANKNVGVQHEKEKYRVAVPIQDYQNRLDYAKTMSNAYTNQGNRLSGNAQATGQAFHQLGQGASSIFNELFNKKKEEK